MLLALLLFGEILLCMGADLDNGSGLDNLGDALPLLVVKLEALKKEFMFANRPATYGGEGRKREMEISIVEAK